jgi:hypothetical protein
MENLNSDVPIYIFDVEPLEEFEYELDGELIEIEIIAFESVKEGEIIKICTENHDLGISTEYAWIDYKYPGYERTKQSLYFMKLNGKDVRCDILTIENGKDTKYIFFDISDFFLTPLKDYHEMYEDEKKNKEDDVLSFKIILHKKKIDNKILLGIHKITGESLNTLKNKIENGEPIFTLEFNEPNYGPNSEDRIRLEKYLKENKIAF